MHIYAYIYIYMYIINIYISFYTAEGTEHEILSEGLTCKEFEEILKEKIKFGMTLQRTIPVEEQEAADNDPELNADLAFKFANKLKQGTHICMSIYIHVKTVYICLYILCI
jgi:hypothetical protein